MLGIDFGTTRTKAAFVDPTGKANIIVNERGEHQTPTAVFVGTNGDNLYGTDAIEQGAADASRLLRNFKLKLGDNENLLNNGELVTAKDATAMFLGQIKATIEKSLGQTVEYVVATCPANFHDDHKQALLDAFKENGMTVAKLMTEPAAAGYAYAIGKTGAKAEIAVFDLGGGTFDVSILSVNGKQIIVRATEGIPALGGNDFSAPIRDAVLAKIEKELGIQPTRETHPVLFLDLDAKAEAAKISLGQRPEVPIVISCDGSTVKLTLKRDAYHDLIKPLIKQTLDAMDLALDAAKTTYDQIDHIVMVGGGSRMPIVQEMVADHTGIAPKMDIDPEKAICYGAALECVAEMAKNGHRFSFRGCDIPSPDVFLQEVTAHTIGCCVVDKAANASRNLINAEIIPNNTAVPCQKVEHFFLDDGQQNAAHIEILQGKANAARDDCLIIGELALTDLPPEAKRSPRIRVEIAIDANGMVTATATDLISGKTQSVSVDYQKGIKSDT